MTRPRILAIYLDGYEQSLAQRYMDAGAMPAMSRLQQQGASWLLDHGPAQRTGLAGEHFATGMAPAAAGRWAAVDFDPATYRVWQVGTELRPFPADLSGLRTVVFDPPYFRLEAAPNVQGLVNWGAHDPGVATSANPPALLQELLERFGEYPATPFIYGFTWPSPERTQQMGQQLAHAVDVRSRAAQWLLGERMPEWDLALVTVSEPHSVIEALWHGVDPEHPLHGLPSAAPAAAGMLAVYQAVDRLVGELAAAFPDAVTVVVSMGGMGPNRSDAASMLLLPELMYRSAFGRALFDPAPTAPPAVAGGPPLLPYDAASWDSWARRGFARPQSPSRLERLWSRLRAKFDVADDPAAGRAALVSELDWMAAKAYQVHWPAMPVFALPSFYDGRVRVNLKGRERDGIIDARDYVHTVSAVETLLDECTDPLTGEPVVDFFEYPADRDPLQVGATESDLVIVWRGMPLGLEHPRLGCIGPVPFRRTGGHTGPHGIVHVAGAGLAAGLRGVGSSFDVVPTLLDLLGESPATRLSGQSLLRPAA